jgi:hypothetical protein
MCLQAWENAYTERVNRTIKEEYLNAWLINSYSSLVKAVNKAVKAYNGQRPHSSLNMMCPVDYEQSVSMLFIEQRPRMQIYKAAHDSNINSKKKKV